MNKTELRAYYLQKRKALFPEDVTRLSNAILDQFRKLSFQDIKVVHIYYPIIGKHEFNSLLLADWLKNYRPEINLVLPKMDADTNTLSSILWEKGTPLAMNQWGITEPEWGTAVKADEIDMVIIPLLAFDKKGNRLGYGKGFYDRFLATCPPDIQKIGLSFFDPEEMFEEVNKYDVPLSKCICPGRIWEF